MNEREAVTIVQEKWAKISMRMHQETHFRCVWLVPLIDTLRQHPRIGQLFPFTSHFALCLSRTTGYPFSEDCPHILAIREGIFRVQGPKYVMVIGTYKEHRWREAEYEVLGEGGLREAVAWIDAALPPGCGPAVKGNLDDLYRLEGKSVMAPATRSLHIAAFQGNENEVMALLRNGIDVNAVDYHGFTALMMAALLGRTTMIRLLLDHGADVHARNQHNETALSLAVFEDKHPESVTLLRSAGAVE